jgi:3-hydroxyacyl-[acyl-carrier-protein] dehydratase
MLSGDFYYTKALQQVEGKIKATLEINAKHTIFDGHFPGQPVVPGVCMVQMVKEILESVLAKQMRLVSADHIKFLTVIDPTHCNVVHAELTYSYAADEKIKLAAALVNGPVTYFKMNAILGLL